jgi:effector-binding domain-containing protein
MVSNELYFMDQDTAMTDFYLEKTDEGTKVTWTTDIPHLSYPVGRYFGLFMPGMMGRFFNSGLENLKEVTAKLPDPLPIEKVTMPETMVLSIADSCHWDEFEVTMAAMFGELMGFIQGRRNVNIAGYPYTMYIKWNEQERFAAFRAGIPVDNATRTWGRVEFSVLPETTALKTTHYGRYEDIGRAYTALDEYVREFDMEETCCPMEVYVTDPTMEPDTSKWQTDVYFPLN